MTRYQRLEAPLTRRQQFTEIADLGDGFVVYVSRWPVRRGYDDQPRSSEVAWLDANRYHYLPPQVAREFAAALNKAADEIEREEV